MQFTFSTWPIGRWALTAAIGFVGVAIALAINMPLPWLLGPLFAGLIASLVNVRTATPAPFSTAVRAVLGLAIGTSFKPEMIDQIGDMASSLALVPLYILVIALIGYPYFRKVCGFDKPTAYFCAMPGGLQDMLIFGEEAGANPRALSLVHATRMLIIVAALPFLLTWYYEIDTSRATGGPPATGIPPHEIALMAAIAIVGYLLAKRLNIFGPAIMGPMILSAAASMTGLLHFRPPGEIIIVAQFVIGVSIGTKYVGLTVTELRQLVVAAIGYCLALLVIAAAFERAVVAMGAATPLEAILAFAPGGQAEMTVLAIVAGADVAFVALHHVLRVFIVIMGAPLFGSRMRN